MVKLLKRRMKEKRTITMIKITIMIIIIITMTTITIIINIIMKIMTIITQIQSNIITTEKEERKIKRTPIQKL